MSKSKNFSRGDFIQALCGGEAWSIAPDWARIFTGWAGMEDFNPQAIVTQAGERFGTGMTRTSVRDGVGIMQVRGPLFAHENFMSYFFGFDTYESLAADFQNLMNDPKVQGVVLNFHSPGGTVAGGSDLASMIYDARGMKPKGIVARAGGDMASMAYWLGSSAEQVHVASTGMVGSIGTVIQFQQEEPGTVTIVSDQSPRKRVDPSTLEGQADLKNTLNALSSVFISQVARNRGVSEDVVLSDFGKGGVLVGQAAVDIGMADRVSTFESTFHQIRTTTQENSMSVNPSQAQAQAPTPAPAAPAVETQTAPVTPAATAPTPDNSVQEERARITGILAVFEGLEFSGDSQAFIAEGKSIQEAQAHAFGKLRASRSPAAPAAPAVTQSALAAEGTLAAAAAHGAGAAPVPAADSQALSMRRAMTAGANLHRSKLGATAPKNHK